MKNLITHWIKAIALFAMLLPATVANSQNFTLSVQNLSQTAPNKLDFDVYLLNTNVAQPFELASIQLGFMLNSLTYSGGTLTAAINNAGSGLVAIQQFAALGTNNVVSSLAGYPNETLIRVPGRSPAGSGNGTIISTVAPGTLVTHFTLTSTSNFIAGSTPNLAFTSTSSSSPLYATVITEYIATVNTLLTVTSGTNAIVSGNPALNSGPAAFNVTGSGAYCQLTSGLPVGLSGSESGVTYTLYKNAVAQTPTVAGTGAAISFGNQLFGTYTVSGTSTGGTTPMTGSAILTETPAPSATISYTGSPFCTTNSALQPVTLTGTTGGTYSSTTGLTIDASTGAITPNTSTPGTYTVTYTVPASGGCSIYTTTTSVTIIAGPAATISYAGTPFCTSVSAAQAATLTGTTGGTFSASPVGLSISPTSGAITPGLSTPGNYTVTYTIPASGGCSIVTATASVTIVAAPTVTISYAGTPFCKSVSTSQAVTLTGAANGTFSASPAGLTIDPATGAITPSASTAGIYTVTYTIPAAGGCSVVTTTTSVAITTAPSATISYLGAPFCISNATPQTVTLTGTSGGIYSAPAGLTINAATGAIIPNTSTAGTYLVTYTIAASGGCAVVTATTSVTVDPAPVGGTVTGGTTPIILGQSTGTLTLAGYSGTIVKWQERLGTGTWVDLAFTTNTLSDIPNAVGVWEYHAVIGSGSCGSVNSSSVFITVNPSSAGTVTGGTTPICLGSSTGIMTLSGYTGTVVNWEKRVNATSTWTSIANTANTYQEIPSTSGTWDYRAVTNNGSLLYSAPATIYVNAVSVGGTIASAQTICSGTAPVDLVLSGNVGSVVKWQYASDAAFTTPVDIAVTTNTLLGSTIGNLTANTYFRAVVQNSVCSSAFSSAVLITVTPLPTASISYAGTPFCTSLVTSQSVTFSGTVGGVYIASPAGLIINSTTGAITSGTSTPGNYTVTYTVAAAGGCNVVSTTTVVTITAAPTASISYAGNPFCISIATDQAVTLGGSLSGTFSAPAGLTINAATGAINPASSVAGTYLVSYTIPAAGGCLAVVATTSVTIQPSSVGGTVSGGSNICSGTTSGILTLSGHTGIVMKWQSAVAPFTTWTDIANTLPTYTSGSLLQTTQFRAVVQSGSCSVANSSATTVAVDPILAAPTATATLQPTCSVSTGTITVTAPTGVGMTYSIDGINYLNSNGIFTLLNTGSYNVTAKSATGCVSPSTSVTINPVPSTPSTPVVGIVIQPSCATSSGSVSLSGLPATGNWTINPGSLVGSGTSTIISNVLPGTYNFTVINSTGCASSATANVVINAQPSTPTAPVVGTITQPTCALATGSVLLSGLPSGSWTIMPGNVTGSTTTTTISGLAAGTYNFTVANATCTSPASVNVVINAQPSTPTAPVVGTITQPTCALATGSVLLSGLPSGSWTIMPGNITGSTPTTTISGLAAGTYNFTVANATCSSPASTNVVINTQPATPTTPVVGTITQPTCATATGSVLLSGLPASGSWTINPGAITGSGTSTTISNLAAGTYNFTVANATCTSPVSVNVVINVQPSTPTAPIVGTITQPTCAVATGSVLLSGLPSGSWTIMPGNITGSTPTTTISGLAAGTYNFTVANATCSSPASTNVVINAQPSTPTAPVVGTITQPTCAVATGSVLLSGLPSGSWTIMPGNITGSTPTTTISGLAAGIYNFTVANATCSSPASTNVVINTQPATPTTPVVGTITQPTCAVATGSVLLSGLPAGSWTIMPGNITGSTTTTTISGLAAGTYNFTVANATCTSPVSVNVVINVQPSTPTAPIVGTITQPTCAVATGSVLLSGLPSGNWTIMPGNITGSTTTTTISGLAAGTYNFTVANATCTSPATANVVINAQPATPTAPLVGTITQPTCAVATGSVLLSGLPASGSWTINPGAITGSGTSTTISNLAAGTYNFTVANTTCTSPASANVLINAQPATPTAPTASATLQPTCAVATGTITVTAPMGTGLTYSIDGTTYTNTTGIFTSVAAGTYSVTVKNTTGCISNGTSVTINAQPSATTAPVVGTITQPTCASATGSVLLSGLPTGSWTIMPGNITGSTTTTTITGLAAGTYNITVSNGTCSSPASANVVINAQPAPPSVPIVGTITQPSCSVSTGSVVLIGLPAGNWTINPGSVTGAGSSTILSGLTAGSTYNFTVTNSVGCTSTASASVVFSSQPTDPTWTGAVNNDWNNPANWCSGTVPSATNNLVITNNGSQITLTAASGSPVVCNNLTIEPGAVLIIAPDGSLTVNGTLTNNQPGGIILQSDANRTGSLIVNAVAGTGTTVAQRYMTTGAWHMVSCPINNESVAGFIAANPHIATRTDGVSRGLMDYDPINNKWNIFFTDGLTNGNVGSGKGFAIHTNVSDIVTFDGTLQAGTQTITGLIPGSWNCVGNPYSSTIGINRNSSATANFLNENGVNATNLDPNYGVIYIWDQPDASNGQPGKYTIISNTPLDNAYDVQQGQGFFVKMNTGATSLTFNRSMQIHNPTLGFKATKAVWPLIKLHATAGGQTSTTYLAFNDVMHKGLDPTYDAGLLKGSADIAVYSQLVQGNTGIPFAIQALPDNESGMLIPIGLDYNTGGQVVFSTDLVNIPSDCKVILEDLVARTITDISKGNYTVTVDPKTSITDRFRLYTSKAISGIDQGSLVGKLFAYADRNVEIRVIGNVSNNTVATLYDNYGRVVLVQKLEEGSVNIIPLKNNKIGAYVLSVNDNGKISGFKILVRE